MKERPILFSTPMVQAILSSAKTQTRRVVKKQPCHCGEWLPIEQCATTREGWQTSGRSGLWTCESCLETPIRCPYGEIGDRLWVRETFSADPSHDGTWCFYEYTDGVLHNFAAIPERFQNPSHVLYKATYENQDLRWHPSIHMPRWASRILLEIGKVRVERVDEISEFDALSEGFRLADHEKGTVRLVGGGGAPVLRHSAIEKFRQAWDKMHGENSFQSGLWVWVIEFKVSEIKK